MTSSFSSKYTIQKLIPISTICNISKSLLELSSDVATYFLTTATLTKFFLALILLTSFERRENLLSFPGFETKQDTSRQMRSSRCTNHLQLVSGLVDPRITHAVVLEL